MRRSTVLLLAALGLLSGCGPAGRGDSNARVVVGPARPVPVETLTCGSPDTTQPGRLPDRRWVAVAECPVTVIYHGSPAPPAAAPTVRPGDLTALVGALAEPDAPRRAAICPALAVSLPRFWLVDGADRAYLPYVPVDACDQPAPRVMAALARLG